MCEPTLQALSPQFVYISEFLRSVELVQSHNIVFFSHPACISPVLP